MELSFDGGTVIERWWFGEGFACIGIAPFLGQVEAALLLEHLGFLLGSSLGAWAIVGRNAVPE